MMNLRSSLLLWLNRHPKIKTAIKKFRDTFFLKVPSVSSGYVSLAESECLREGKRLRSAWKDERLPSGQRALVELQLKQYESGEPVIVFDVFVSALQKIVDVSTRTLLEIGCSSGHYAEVIQMAGIPLKYSGCDYSPAFINLAREKYPEFEFLVEDATSLNYSDQSYDVVVSGCCLLHIPEYKEAIKEAARVSRQFVIFHRTPVVIGKAEQWFRKEAYGVETVEIHFNEIELLETFTKNNLDVLDVLTLSDEYELSDKTEGKAVRTYVCKRRDDL